MMSRIGLLGNAGWAVYPAEAAMSAGMATVANSLAARIGPSSLFSNDAAPRARGEPPDDHVNAPAAGGQ
jgi:hypothetical protein